jgi:predicted metal-dependent phosphoesterase TrpH
MKCAILDLHNHSACSYDASSRFAHYKHAFHRGLFDVVAITDHNTTRAKHSFLNDEFRVIIGQEVDTRDGELLCLFLDSAAARDVPLHRSAVDTAKEIRERGGLVYLQHPYYRCYGSRTGFVMTRSMLF